MLQENDTSLIKLRLKDAATFAVVQSLPGLKDIELDENYGLVCINPKENLFVVRASAVNRMGERQQISPEILGAYGDTRISTEDSSYMRSPKNRKIAIGAQFRKKEKRRCIK